MAIDLSKYKKQESKTTPSAQKENPYSTFGGSLKESAKLLGKSIITPVIKAGTYGQNVLATGEDILGGRYIGTEVPSMIQSAEERRQSAKEQETKAFNLFDFSPTEQTIASTTSDVAASVGAGAGLIKFVPKIAGLMTAPKSVLGGIGQGVATGAGSEVPYRILSEGRIPTVGEVAKGATVGGVTGGVIGTIPKISKYGEAISGGGLMGGIKSVKRDLVNKIDVAKVDTETIGKIRQAIKPTTTGIDSLAKANKQEKNLLAGVKEVVQAGKTPKNMKQALEDIQTTKQELWKQAEQQNKAVTKMTNAEDFVSDLNNILKDKEYTSIFRAKPEAEKSIRNFIEEIKTNPRWKTQSQEDLQNTLSTINESLPTSSFLKQLDSNPAETIKNTLVAKALRSRIDNNLEEAIGAGSQELRKRYGSVRQLEKEMAKRYATFAKNNPAGLADMFGIDALPEVAAGLVTGNVGRVVRGVGVAVARDLIKLKNNPDKIIKDVFKMQKKIMK